VQVLRRILAKIGELGGLPPDLAQKLRRYAPPPPAGGGLGGDEGCAPSFPNAE